MQIDDICSKEKHRCHVLTDTYIRTAWPGFRNLPHLAMLMAQLGNSFGCNGDRQSLLIG